MFELLVALSNDFGLLAEEYDPAAKLCSAISAGVKHFVKIGYRLDSALRGKENDSGAGNSP